MQKQMAQKGMIQLTQGATHAEQATYSLPVKTDDLGRAWLSGQMLKCPFELPASKRGVLTFANHQASLLFGPWGPSPDRYLILPARLLSLTAEGYPVLHLSNELDELVLPIVQNRSLSHLRRGAKVWIAIEASALGFHG